MTLAIYSPQPYVIGGGGKGARSGLVRAAGRLHADDTGIFDPLGATFFWLYWGWKHDQPRTRQNAEYVAPWADHVRVLGEVGGATWEDRTVDPRDADYVDTWRAIVDYLWRGLGVRLMFTIFGGGTGADVDMTVGKVIEVIRGRQEAFLCVEACNEGNGISRDKAREISQRLQREFPGLLVATTSDTPADGTRQQLDLDVASCGETHTERQDGDEGWRQVRQGCELMGLPKPKGGSEPPGPQSSVAELWDPLRLGSLRRVHVVGGTTRWVVHLGAGVRGGGAADLARGRLSNFWEYDGPGLPSTLSAIVAAVRATDGLLPADCANWSPMKGHWAESRVVADMIWSDDPARYDHGCVRAYGSYTGDQFVDAVIGIRRYVNLTLRFGAWQVRVHDLRTGALVQQLAVPDGGTFRVEGDPTGGSDAAVLLLATR